MARILVIDDVTPIRDIITSILVKRGHRVYEARSGEDAIEVANQKKLHLVLTDINMPGIDGIETIRRLQQLENCAQVPIVVLAKNANDVAIEKAKLAGAVDWIAKPFSEDILVNKVNQVLVNCYVN